MCNYILSNNYQNLGDLSCPYDDDYRCSSDGACIRSYQVCDGVEHCIDKDDEANCGESFLYTWIHAQ